MNQPVITNPVRVFYESLRLTVNPGAIVDVPILIEINLAKIRDVMGPRAYRNKRKQASAVEQGVRLTLKLLEPSK